MSFGRNQIRRLVLLRILKRLTFHMCCQRPFATEIAIFQCLHPMKSRYRGFLDLRPNILVVSRGPLWNKKHSFIIPFRYRPRSTPSVPLVTNEGIRPGCPIFHATIKSAPEVWFETLSILQTKPASGLQPVEVQVSFPFDPYTSTQESMTPSAFIDISTCCTNIRPDRHHTFSYTTHRYRTIHTEVIHALVPSQCIRRIPRTTAHSNSQ
ncbi:hypothetical protein F5880DRAFT_177687 [Lentinula raphanica]|nr:hypothetical protein F5880DRAFT_177687 [Lentinula raphanica]